MRSSNRTGVDDRPLPGWHTEIAAKGRHPRCNTLFTEPRSCATKTRATSGQLSTDLISPTADGSRTGQPCIYAVARSSPRAEAARRPLDAFAALARFHGTEPIR